MQANANATTFTGNALAANLLGILAALIVVALVFKSRLPFLGTDRAAFIALVVVGMTMCALGGIGRAQSTIGWTDPVTLFGIAIGSLALVLVAAVLTGKDGFLAPVSVLVGESSSLESATDRAATLVLAGLIAVKWAIGLLFLQYARRAEVKS
jgi:hypothetical protein